jgi:voltage-gated potassium channel
MRRRIAYILDGGSSGRLSHRVHQLLVALVLLSVGAVVFESVPEYRRTYGVAFDLIEYCAALVFSLEYILRLWCAPELPQFSDWPHWRARLSLAQTPSALIDLIAVVPIYLTFLVPGDFRVLMLLRLLRFFKLARYSPGMRSLMAALEAERRALAASAVILFGLVLVTASAMHLVEHEAQPDKFGSIPSAMWWSIVTLTTVGYGDVYPVTLAGRMVASVTMVFGMMMLALPIGIIATAFAEEIHRREFVITWGMLARVPLFSSLNASEIAEIMDLLHAQTVPANTIIVRKGDPAHCMYFIAQGSCIIELSNGPIELGEGQFFGEIAIIRKTRRTATVRSTEPSKLLVLTEADLSLLMGRNRELRNRIETIVRERTEFRTPNDVIAQELTPPERAEEPEAY